MEIHTEQAQGLVSITVMKLFGELDASCFRDVIARVQQVYQAGGRDLLLDLVELTFMSSAGLVALHSAAMLMRGETPPDTEEGWNPFHSISAFVESITSCGPHFNLLNPNFRIQNPLHNTRFDRTFAVY